MNVKRFLKLATGLGLGAVLFAGCGPIPRSTVTLNTDSTPTAVLVGNEASPTPTVQLAVGIPGALTGGGDSASAGEKTPEPALDPTIAPTQASAEATQPPVGPTTAPVASPTATEPFVVSWLLYGTPTPGPGDPTAVPTIAEPTATQPFVVGWLLYGTPTPVPGQPTATLVPPRTKAPTAAALPPVPTHDMNTTPESGGGNAGAQQGDPERGKQIFNTTGTCNACHDVRVGITIVGPTLKGVATRAEARVPGLSAAQYVRQSIMEPNKYVVQGFAANIMPGTLGTTLRANQISDLVAYLLTLK